jgi:hypothetical protein
VERSLLHVGRLQLLLLLLLVADELLDEEQQRSVTQILVV